MAAPQVNELTDLIAALSRAEAYPHPVDGIEVHQTHISVVFLAGPYAYKIKKPVNLGFLDFSTIEKRKHFCEEEVRLNRRLAPQVYLGVVGVTSEPEASAKRVRIQHFADASGSEGVIEWAVQMQRLPNETTLEARLERGEVTEAQIRALAQRVAAFHRDAEANEIIASFGRFEIVAQNARENFTQSAKQVGILVSDEVFERIRSLTEAHLAQHRDRIKERAVRGVPRDTHGDLRLDHVYFFPDRAPPEDLVIIDCIEFSDRYRYADPVADVAFLAMDLTFHGRRDLARVLADAYFDASGDADGRPLLPYYSAYRAVIRAKVEGMKFREKEIGADEIHKAEVSANAHWMVALGELEDAVHRPALIVIAGLPGSGKSTLAKAIAEKANFHVLRSDVVRKELAVGHAARVPGGDGTRAACPTDLYTPEWTERTYVALWLRADALNWRGERVIVDANFRENSQRRRFFDAARRWGVPFLFIHCQTSPEVARARLAGRTQDASDADWNVYQQLAASWQPIAADLNAVVRTVDTSGSIDESVRSLLTLLRDEGLFH